MSSFIKVMVASGTKIRVNINHIIYYEPYQKDAYSTKYTRIYITASSDDCIETATNIAEIDKMIEMAVKK
ncbi:hypothetical protein [Paenibacillus qinlingensis]|uniref:Uncharacterized protein n=1 Tax=Paenibacillus qinlingensis TaxID=1837343 RepID=A0ABU1P6U3_9BACL|nr:hypothetical protein [Paenibacillus qinlingensis]MDR6555483.1 hypothetical protein [Paenibacillus qinlingensis]